jgi:predicted N-acetyltransferase YhbS
MEMMRIRPIEARDAKVAAELCTQLGYPVDEAAVLARMRKIAGDAHRAVLVACLDDVVVGWIDLSVEYHLQSEPAALIGGLVVAESSRGRGSGSSFAKLRRIGPGRTAFGGCGCDRTRFGSAPMVFICAMGMRG